MSAQLTIVLNTIVSPKNFVPQGITSCIITFATRNAIPKITYGVVTIGLFVRHHGIQGRDHFVRDPLFFIKAADRKELLKWLPNDVESSINIAVQGRKNTSKRIISQQDMDMSCLFCKAMRQWTYFAYTHSG